MKKLIAPLTLLLLAAALLPSCHKCLKGNKDVTNRTLSQDEIPTYTDVVNPITTDVRLVEGTKSVVFEGEQNIIATFKLEHSGNEITLASTEDCYDNRKDLLTVLTNPSFHKLTNSGTGNWTSDSLSFDPVIVLSGTGNFTLTGVSNSQNVLVSGTGDVDLLSMPTNDATITISGTGNVKVKPAGTLRVTISGTGNVYYEGTPTSIIQTITGTGNVIQL